MTEQEIEAFLAVVNTGNFSSAASNLYVSQPALSRRINGLEEQLGYKLFKRTKGMRAVELTPEGKAFIALAKRWKNLFVESKVLTDSINNQYTFNLGVIGSMCSYLLPPTFDSFISQNEDCYLNIHQYHSEECYNQMEKGSLDLALVGKEMFSKNLSILPICKAPFKLVCKASGLTARELHPSKLDVTKEILVSWNGEFDTWHDYWFGSRTKPRIWLDLMSLLEYFISNRDSWVIAPSYIANALANKYNLNAYDLVDGPPSMMVYALYTKGQMRFYANAFLQVLREQLQDNKDITMLI